MRPRQLSGCSCLGPELHLSLYPFLTLRHSPFWSAAGSSSSWPGASSPSALAGRARHLTSPGPASAACHQASRPRPAQRSTSSFCAADPPAAPARTLRPADAAPPGHPQPPLWLLRYGQQPPQDHHESSQNRHDQAVAALHPAPTRTRSRTTAGVLARWPIAGRISGYWLRNSLCAREKFAYAKGVAPDPGSPSRNIRGGARARSFAFPCKGPVLARRYSLRTVRTRRRISPPVGIYQYGRYAAYVTWSAG